MKRERGALRAATPTAGPPLRVVLFYHSLISDWNNGNAHFLRGIASELMFRGHDVRIYESAGGWSWVNLLRDHGEAPSRGFYEAYPRLRSIQYDLKKLDLEAALGEADLVIVHEWTDPDLVRRIGRHRRRGGRYRLFFHDTHHRAVTRPDEMRAYDLSSFDGVLAFGAVVRDLYLRRSWARRAWTWHECADTRVFCPVEPSPDGESPARHPAGDLVWVGNWGDNERTAELQEFLLGPVRRLGLKAHVYGVRYPPRARKALKEAGIEYGGWLPNYEAPAVFSRHKVTVHVPRRPYVQALPGIPTIRPFEAMACGIPLVSSPWQDTERLFTVGKDYLVARDGREMEQQLKRLLEDAGLRESLATHALATIRAGHTCAHRVDQLLEIYQVLS